MYTSEMKQWLTDNYYVGISFVEMAKEFNRVFNESVSNCVITKRCERLGLHKPLPKTEMVNAGQFKAHRKNCIHDLPIGTMRTNSDGRIFVKVKESDGFNVQKNGSHNYREPYWKPLQKKIWEDYYGEVPEGYAVYSLTNNLNETDINNLYCMETKLAARMAKNGWWTTNKEITRTGIMCVQLDNEIRKRR